MKPLTSFSLLSMIAVTGLFYSPSVLAKSEYQAMDTCGSAKVVEGNTCSNVKVEINFAGCALQSEPHFAKRVICEGKKIKARFDSGEYRYEAHFEKKDNGWGKVEWASLGPVNQMKKLAKQHVLKKIDHHEFHADNSQPERTIAAAQPPQPVEAIHKVPEAMAIIPPPAGIAHSPFKFSAFADFRYTAFDTSQNPTNGGGNSHAESGFGVEDGAFYATYEKDRVSIVADVSFRRGMEKDLASASNPANTPNASTNSDLRIGADKSQLFLKYHLADGLNVNLGQFDTIYGVELNDSKDRAFSKTGIIYDGFVPVVHSGVMIDYTYHGVYGKIMAVNPNGKGSNGASSSGDNNTEYGAVVGYANDTLRGQVGYLTRPIMTADKASSKDRSLVNVTAGVTIGNLAIDAEYDLLNDPNKNSLTADAGDFEVAAQGVLLLTSYKLTDAFLVAAKYEYFNNDPAGASIDTAQAYGLTFHYRIAPEVELRSDYVGFAYKNTASQVWNENRFNIGAVIQL